MLRLILTEIRRYSRRSLFWFGLLALFAVLGLALVSTWSSSAPPSSTELAEAQQWADDANAYYVPGGQCEQDEAATGEYFGCAEQRGAATAADFLTQATYEYEGLGSLRAVSWILLFYVAAVAVSFITAEYSNGSIGNWLTFEPRRTRVYASKLVALLVCVGLVVVCYLTLASGGLRLVYSLNDALGENVAGTDALMIESAEKFAVLALVLAGCGYAIGTMLRNAALSLGAIGAYFVFDSVITLLDPQSARFMVVPHISAWVEGSFMVSEGRGCTDDMGIPPSCTVPPEIITANQGVVYLAAVAVAFVIAAGLIFRRRDLA